MKHYLLWFILFYSQLLCLYLFKVSERRRQESFWNLLKLLNSTKLLDSVTKCYKLQIYHENVTPAVESNEVLMNLTNQTSQTRYSRLYCSRLWLKTKWASVIILIICTLSLVLIKNCIDPWTIDTLAFRYKALDSLKLLSGTIYSISRYDVYNF